MREGQRMAGVKAYRPGEEVCILLYVLGSQWRALSREVPYSDLHFQSYYFVL